MFLICSRCFGRRGDVGVWRLWARAGLSNQVPELYSFRLVICAMAITEGPDKATPTPTKIGFGLRRYLRLALSPLRLHYRRRTGRT